MERMTSIRFFDRQFLLPRYLSVEKPEKDTSTGSAEAKFQHLLSYITTVPYTETPHYLLTDGANCQTMTMYVEDWARVNNIDYHVVVEPFHVYILVKIEKEWVIINFNKELEVKYERTGKSIL